MDSRRLNIVEKIKNIAIKFRQEIKLYQLVIKDKRTPVLAKILLMFAVGYTLLPIDIIPDFIPIIGHLDDLVIIPLLVFIAIKIIPKEIIEENRKKILNSK